ncbi:hypothetical protein MBM_05629 [Drepanopeziza brunnea f. sp. 'multigermtubi' MB_m1]|uniref:Uncharacterized protein n=1 Tax=Marssonina brunnea f. sp. multigermtubi (strain MB_m1) TaxID=1072389 RepID=K1WFS3_MARBU|nr:uncharacterized protein MBM_05629 [Drepanopeziza brunnea f. sp. 'multigermtubi' MB_m1]EKD16335.1 hypothetical protein MBM_05629 [Drepanopeziza brunnea f. sp. 'multigermtubi' MB_m1]
MPPHTPTKDGLPSDNTISRPCAPSLAPPDYTSMTTPKKGNAKVSPDKVTKSASKNTTFRFPWMKKKNSKGLPFDGVATKHEGADLADSSQVKRVRAKKGPPHSKSSPVGLKTSGYGEAGNGDPFTEQYTMAPITPVQATEHSDSEGEEMGTEPGQPPVWMDQNGLISDWEVPRAQNTVEKTRKKQKAVPGVKDPNGRVVGRGLVLWHRPRMMEKLMLCVQYECHKAGIRIPWDEAVHRLNPGSSGPSAVQHLNKLRDTLVAEGHLIPPALGKVTEADPAWLRGYARDHTKQTPTATRSVPWNEALEHPKVNLVIPGIIKGSGNYRAVPKEQRVQLPPKEEIDPAIGHRVRIPADLVEEAKAARVARGSRRKRGTRAPRPKQDDVLDGEAEPAELGPDDEYKPNKKKGGRGKARQTSRGKAGPPPPILKIPVPPEYTERVAADGSGNEGSHGLADLGGAHPDQYLVRNGTQYLKDLMEEISADVNIVTTLSEKDFRAVLIYGATMGYGDDTLQEFIDRRLQGVQEDVMSSDEGSFLTAGGMNVGQEEQMSGTGYGEEQISSTGYGEEQMSSTGYGEEQMSGTGYGEEQMSGTGYGEEQMSSTGYGEQQISGTGYGEEQQQDRNPLLTFGLFANHGSHSDGPLPPISSFAHTYNPSQDFTSGVVHDYSMFNGGPSAQDYHNQEPQVPEPRHQFLNGGSIFEDPPVDQQHAAGWAPEFDQYGDHMFSLDPNEDENLRPEFEPYEEPASVSPVDNSYRHQF